MDNLKDIAICALIVGAVWFLVGSALAWALVKTGGKA